VDKRIKEKTRAPFSRPQKEEKVFEKEMIIRRKFFFKKKTVLRERKKNPHKKALPKKEQYNKTGVERKTTKG
jgi:hypothetical protein